mgnify:CR=1 FL=1
MSFGKMNGFADIIITKKVKDSEGFTTMADEVLASVRVYREGCLLYTSDAADE